MTTYQLLHQDRNKARKEGPDLHPKFLSGISRTTPKDPTQDIPSPNVIWNTTITQRECQCSNMIGNYTVRGVETIHIFLSEQSFIGPNASHFLDFVKDWREYICVIV
jgi:hypothetical protein